MKLLDRLIDGALDRPWVLYVTFGVILVIIAVVYNQLVWDGDLRCMFTDNCRIEK